MLDLNKSTLIETIQHAIASNIVRLEEGQAMVAVLENGKMKVKPSTGAAGEHLIGVSIARAAMTTVAPRIEEVTIPAASPYTVNLARNPSGIVGITVVDGSSRTNLTVQGSADSTHFSRSGQVVTFDASFAGKKAIVRYSYDVSSKEAMLMYGGFDAFVTVDLATAPVVGIIREGIIFTSCYDPLVDWDAVGTGGLAVRLASDGRFTLASSGNGSVISATVYETPSASSNGMLALVINQ